MKRGSKMGWATVIALAVAFAVLLERGKREAAASRVELRTMAERHAMAEAALRELRSPPSKPEYAAPEVSALAAPERALRPDVPAPSESELLREATARREALLRTWLPRAYAPFAETAKLTPAQFEGLQTAVSAHLIRWGDVVDVGREQKVPAADPKWAELGKTEWARYFKEAEAVIGADAVKDLWQYERRAPAKAAAETVAALVFDSGAPLTIKQTSALTGAILQNSAKFRQGGQVSLEDIDKPAVLEQLGNILTAEQLAALQMSWTARESGPKLTRLISEALKPARDGK